MAISFREEQLENLKRWKNILQRDEAKTWAETQEKAEERFHEILSQANFEQGGILTSDKLDELFRTLKHFSANRNLSNLLYKDAGLKNFNQQLRNLYYGNEPFPKRVDKFFEMKGIGIQTISQFLVALDSRKYPLITTPTKEMLNLDSDQEEMARKEALKRYEIENLADYHERTIDFLADAIIFESVKLELNMEKYTQVNNLLYHGEETPEEESETEAPSTSLSMEKDLREYLAANPSAIEKGLTLVKKEFPTKEAGNIDLLCKDKNGNMVIVELKKGRKSDEVIGQTLRYMGWVAENQKTNVRGIIIVHEPDDRLEYALVPVKNIIELKYYRAKFEISPTYSSAEN